MMQATGLLIKTIISTKNILNVAFSEQKNQNQSVNGSLLVLCGILLGDMHQANCRLHTRILPRQRAYSLPSIPPLYQGMCNQLLSRPNLQLLYSDIRRKTTGNALG